MGKCKDQLVMSAVDTTFGRNGRYQTKDLPSLICSSNLLVWQLSPQEVKGHYVSQRGIGFIIHSLMCLHSVALLPIKTQSL